MSWRPKDWEYQYESEGAERCGDGYEVILGEIYEAGADAMLEALRKEGTHFKAGEWTDDSTFETEVPGIEVFIPDEVKK